MLNNERGGSKADTAVKLALIFFISLFSFSMGTFVGKQISDNERKRATTLEDDYKKHRNVASTGHDEMGVDPKEAISNEDVENLTAEFLEAESHNMKKKDAHAADDGHAQKKAHPTSHEAPQSKDTHQKDGYKKMDKQKNTQIAKVQTPEPEAHKKEAHPNKKSTKKAHKKTKVSNAADRVSKGHPPTPHKTKKRKPSSVLPKLAASTIGKYTVQVSSYSSEQEAKHHAANLKTQGYSAFYIPAQVKGKTWYRVSIGLFDNYQSANHFRKELKKEAKVSSSLVQKIVQ